MFGRKHRTWILLCAAVVLSVLTGCALEIISRTATNGYSVVVLADNPLSYWRLNEKSGLVATDSGSLHYHLGYSSNGVTYGLAGALSEPTSSAVQFDGSTGRAYVSTLLTGLNFGATNRFSIELWVKTTQTGVILVSNYVGSHYGYYIDLSAGKARLILGSSGSQLVYGYASAINDGAWHHLVFVHTPTSRVMYFDGALDPTTYSTAASVSDNAIADFEIGAGIAGGYGFVAGQMQEVAIYGSALTASQVTAHYQARTLK